MKRREFTGLLFLAAIGRAPAALAQAAVRVSRIAVLRAYGETAKNIFVPISRRAFDQALRDLRWIDGLNVHIEYRDAGGDYERLRSLAMWSFIPM